jgi:hypothetical protein
VALQVGAERRVRAVALEAPMASMRGLEMRILSKPLGWLVPIVSANPFKPRDVVQDVTAPVWVAVGGRDTRIRESSARSLFDVARVRGEFLVVPSARHDEIAERGGDEYWAWLGRVLGADSVPPAPDSVQR